MGISINRAVTPVDCSSVYQAGTTSSVPGVVLQLLLRVVMLSLTLAAGL